MPWLSFPAPMNSLCSSVSPAVVPCPHAPLNAAVHSDCSCPGLPLGASCWTSQPFCDSNAWESPVQAVRNGSYLKIKTKTKCSDFPSSFVTLSRRAIIAYHHHHHCVLCCLPLLFPVAAWSFLPPTVRLLPLWLSQACLEMGNAWGDLALAMPSAACAVSKLCQLGSRKAGRNAGFSLLALSSSAWWGCLASCHGFTPASSHSLPHQQYWGENWKAESQKTHGLR